ncbi:hypothetical protein C8R42DRAFT_595460, partial [Lentinula raphanica]
MSPLSSVSTTTPTKADKGKATTLKEGIDLPSRQRSETITSNESSDFYPRILAEESFVSARDEPLHASCIKLHPVFDPLDYEHDPLLAFGSVNGLVPGLDQDNSDILREVIIRWTMPLITEFPFGTMYQTIQSYVRSLPSLTFTESDFKRVDSKGDEVSPWKWTLIHPHLNALTHAALGLNQILRALAKLHEPLIKNYFLFDPRFKFVRLLEGHHDLNVVKSAVECLKTRAGQSSARISDLLRMVKFNAGVAIDDEDYGSEVGGTAFSTVSEVREQFGEDPGPVELGKLLLRPEY